MTSVSSESLRDRQASIIIMLCMGAMMFIGFCLGYAFSRLMTTNRYILIPSIAGVPFLFDQESRESWFMVRYDNGSWQWSKVRSLPVSKNKEIQP